MADIEITSSVRPESAALQVQAQVDDLQSTLHELLDMVAKLKEGPAVSDPASRDPHPGSMQSSQI